MKVELLFEDNHLLVVNKPVGILVQGDRTRDIPLVEHLKSYIKEKYRKPGKVFLGVVHRLDRPTSGVLVFARTSKALKRLNEQFRLREPKKIYWSLVEGTSIKASDRLVHWMIRKPKLNKSFAYPKKTDLSKEAILQYRCLKRLDLYSFLEVQLETGRHHQIRAQLSKIGFPIKGDLKYGAARSNPGGGIHLHARELSLIHPVTKKHHRFLAPLPKESLWNLIENDDSFLPSAV